MDRQSYFMRQKLFWRWLTQRYYTITYKVLDSWTVMEETPKENMKGSRGEMEHDKENKDNVNDKQSDNDNGKQNDDDGSKRCDNGNEYEVNSAENSLYWSWLLNWLTDQTICWRSNILVEDEIKEPRRLCQRKLQNWKYGLCCHLEKHLSLGRCWSYWLFYHSQISQTYQIWKLEKLHRAKTIWQTEHQWSFKVKKIKKYQRVLKI